MAQRIQAPHARTATGTGVYADLGRLEHDEVSGIRSSVRQESVTRIRITLNSDEEDDGLPHFDDGLFDLGDSDGG